jgi:DNA helicase HerA-like ATPase
VYSAFNATYAGKHDGRSWHDDRLTGLLSIFEYPNGVRALRPLLNEHDPNSAGDYAQDVVTDLLAGKLVIFDQSLGDPDMNRAAAERIMWVLFNRQKQSFVSPKKDAKGGLLPPPDVLVYAEEAHNLLPASSAADVSNIWSRVAKEGSKYRIGLVYATQEPSSIQSNIMKNTDNWFVAHLNNSDETRELRKYYDFDDFVQSILQVPDPGFLRMRTLSNPYIVPVQVNRFRVKV